MRRGALLAVGIALMACRRPVLPGPVGDREAAAEAKARFEAFALEPARQPPPSLEVGVRTAEAGTLIGVAELVRPELAPWNRGADGSPLLFNDRWVYLAEVRVEGEGLQWVADKTSLELNSPDVSLRAAAAPDDVLGDLIFWALQEERAGLGEGLVARTRFAGAFRQAYLKPVGTDGRLSGVVAFPAVDIDGMHVVAARLTVAVMEGDLERELVFVFD